MSDSLLLSTRTQFIMSQISSTLDKDAKRRKCTYRHRLPVMHVCIYQYIPIAPRAHITQLFFWHSYNAKLPVKQTQFCYYSTHILKKKEEDNLHGINCTYRIDIERYTSTCMQGCSSHMKRKAIFIRKKITCMYISITNSIYKY